MPFVEQGDDSFTDVPDGMSNAIQIQPLWPIDQKTKRCSPKVIWVHDIPSITTTGPDGKKQYLRNYRTEICVSVGRNGGGCYLDQKQDPFWERLEQRTQYDKKGKRKDFGKKPKLLLGHYNFRTGKVEILDKGSQIYEAMETMHDQGQDIRGCQWLIWKEGSGEHTEYKSSPIVDPARKGVIPADEWAELERQADALLTMAIEKNYQPTHRATLDKLISGLEAQGQQALPPAAATPQLPVPQGMPQQFTPPVSVPQLPPAIPMQTFAPPPPPQFGVPVAPQPPAASAPAAPPPMWQPAAPPPPPQFGAPQSAPQAAPAFVPPTPPQFAPPPAPPQFAAPSAPAAPVAPKFSAAPPVAAAPGGVMPAVSVPAAAIAVSDEEFVLPGSLKNSGKTLGWIMANDLTNFKFLRSTTKDEESKARLTRMLEKAVPAPQMPIVAQAAAAAATAQAMPTAPVFTAPPAQTQMPGISAPGVAPVAASANDAQREAILGQIKGIINVSSKFTGRGLTGVLVPLIKNTIGVVDYTEAPLPDLQKLVTVLQQKASEP